MKLEKMIKKLLESPNKAGYIGCANRAEVEEHIDKAKAMLDSRYIAYDTYVTTIQFENGSALCVFDLEDEYEKRDFESNGADYKGKYKPSKKQIDMELQEICECSVTPKKLCKCENPLSPYNETETDSKTCKCGKEIEKTVDSCGKCSQEDFSKYEWKGEVDEIEVVVTFSEAGESNAVKAFKDCAKAINNAFETTGINESFLSFVKKQSKEYQEKSVLRGMFDYCGKGNETSKARNRKYLDNEKAKTALVLKEFAEKERLTNQLLREKAMVFAIKISCFPFSIDQLIDSANEFEAYLKGETGTVNDSEMEQETISDIFVKWTAKNGLLIESESLHQLDKTDLKNLIEFARNYDK